MPSGSLMASVRITCPFGIELLCSAFGDGLFGAAIDGLAGDRLEFRWDIGIYRLSVAIFGQVEDFRTERDAHAVTPTALVVNPDFHSGVNSKCSSVRPRRM